MNVLGCGIQGFLVVIVLLQFVNLVQGNVLFVKKGIVGVFVVVIVNENVVFLFGLKVFMFVVIVLMLLVFL